MAFLDAVDRAFALILSDDRRKLPTAEEETSKRLWRQVFSKVDGESLNAAVLTWLQENHRGRPNIAEVTEILKRARATSSEAGAEKSQLPYAPHEIRWAIAILQTPERFRHPSYEHTLVMAEHVLRRCGFARWQDAKAHLEPGWSPASVTEVYL